MNTFRTGARKYTKQFNQAHDLEADRALMQRLLELDTREKFIFTKMLRTAPLSLKKSVIDKGLSFKPHTRKRIQMFLGIQDNPRKPEIKPELASIYNGSATRANAVPSPKDYLASFGIEEY